MEKQGFDYWVFTIWICLLVTIATLLFHWVYKTGISKEIETFTQVGKAK